MIIWRTKLSKVRYRTFQLSRRGLLADRALGPLPHASLRDADFLGPLQDGPLQLRVDLLVKNQRENCKVAISRMATDLAKCDLNVGKFLRPFFRGARRCLKGTPKKSPTDL